MLLLLPGSHGAYFGFDHRNNSLITQQSVCLLPRF